jgi:hypothetical protein
VLLFAVGLIGLCRDRSRRRYLRVLFSWLPFLVLASILHKYPLSLRHTLFAVPYFYWLAAEGAIYICSAVWAKHRYIAIVVLACLLLPPSASALQHLVKPQIKQDIRPVMSYLRTHWQPGDRLYTYPGTGEIFDYYAQMLSFPYRDSHMQGCAEPEDALEDIPKIESNRRVYVLVISNASGWLPLQIFLDRLNTSGKRLDFYPSVGFDLYRYEFDQRPATR